MDTPSIDPGGVGSATSFKILSFNANSIGRNPKRRKVFHYLKKKKADFIVVCDTPISKTLRNRV